MDVNQARQAFDQAQALYSAGRIAESLAVLDALDPRFPANPSLAFMRASCYVEDGRLAEAWQIAGGLEGHFKDDRVETLKRRIVERSRLSAARPSPSPPSAPSADGSPSPAPSFGPPVHPAPAAGHGFPTGFSAPSPVFSGAGSGAASGGHGGAGAAAAIPTRASAAVGGLAHESSIPAGPVRQETRPVYYRHSGRFSPVFPLLFLVVSVASTAPLSVIYAYAIVYIPFIYLNLLLTLGFGLAVGYSLTGALVWGQVRNTPLSVGCAAALGLLALYLAWVFWLYAVTRGAAWIFSPPDIVGAMERIADAGVWSVGSFEPTGVWLYLIWLVEAAAIVGLPLVLALRANKDKAYCEETQRWAEKDISVTGMAAIDKPDEFRRRLEAGDFSQLWILPRLADSANCESTSIEFHYDKEQPDFRLITIKNVKSRTDEKGKESTSESTIVDRMFVSQEYYSRIKKVRTLNDPRAAFAAAARM